MDEGAGDGFIIADSRYCQGFARSGELVSSRVLNGRYRLDEIIGSGATVWRAWDRRLDRYVAVKVLDGTGLGGDTDEQARYDDEARTLARLSHPTIVAVFDSGTENGVPYVVMELVEGRSLASRLAEGAVPVVETAWVMAQVCDALAVAHAGGIVHRDIKPGNILLGSGRSVKVCDFGIARLLETTALTSSHAAVGTSSYMSPEQIAGRPLDGRADLYSVGCVLFRILTGAPPFVGENAFAVAYQHVHNAPPTVRSRCPDIPPELDRLIGRLLAKDPARRPATAAEVRGELLRWSDPMTAVLPWSAGRRHRPLARLGVAAVAAIAVPAALVLAWSNDDSPQRPAAAVSPTTIATMPVAASAFAITTPSASDASSPSPSSRSVKVVTSPANSPTAGQPSPRSSPSPRSALDQIMDVKALVRRLETTGQLPPPNADDLDHNLNDLGNLVVQSKQREAHDKLATIQKKNDDLFAADKISATAHEAMKDKLDQLAVAISGIPSGT
jgi:eukaryotic-like serine/threonine-protein kinase